MSDVLEALVHAAEKIRFTSTEDERKAALEACAVLSDHLRETLPIFARYPNALQIMKPERRRHGRVFPAEPVPGHFAHVEPRARIVLFGIRNVARTIGKIEPDVFSPYERTFQLGDEAEYGSYNLHYTGTITAIGKRIVITAYKGREGMEQRHSLDLYTFDWRNYDFDAAAIAAKNAETSMYI